MTSLGDVRWNGVTLTGVVGWRRRLGDEQHIVAGRTASDAH
jgi:hypothetical protein